MSRPILTAARKPKGTLGQLPPAPKPTTSVTVSPEATKPDRRTSPKKKGARPTKKPAPVPVKKKKIKTPPPRRTGQKPSQLRYRDKARAMLVEYWPELINYERPKPLAVGVGDELKADAARRGIDLDMGLFAFGMRDYTQRTTYHLTVVRGGPRYGLEGVRGEIDQKSIDNARQKLREIGKEQLIAVITAREEKLARITKLAKNAPAKTDSEVAVEEEAEPEESLLLQSVREFIYMTGDVIDSAAFGELFPEWNNLKIEDQLEFMRQLALSPLMTWGAYGFGPNDFWFKAVSKE